MCIWWHIQRNHKHTCWTFVTIAFYFYVFLNNTAIAGSNSRTSSSNDAGAGFPTIANLPINNNLQQACDRTRRVFTETQGEISDGPVGYNYTQVSAYH